MRILSSLVLLLILGAADAESASGSSGDASLVWTSEKGPSGACLYAVGAFPKLRKDFFRLLARRFDIPENSFDSARPCAYILFKSARGASGILLVPIRPEVPLPPRLTEKKGYVLLSRDPETIDRVSAALSFTAPSVI